MTDIVRFNHIVELIQHLCPNHVLTQCLERDGMSVNYQRNTWTQMSDGRVAAICNTLNFDLYRGEHRVYPSSKASLYRIQDREERICALAKSYEFMGFLKSLPEVQMYLENHLWYEPWALAQHYEFATPMIDLTNEIAVAAFFATHKYDRVTKQYAVESEGIGCIRVTNMMQDVLEDNMERIRPIGVQPFSRPSNQYGYELWISEDEDFVEQSSVFEFVQDYDVNLRLEQAMAIPQNMYFPNETIVQMASMIKREKVVTSAAVEAFAFDMDCGADFLRPSASESEIRAVLKKHGIFIVDAPVVCPQALPPKGNVFLENHAVVKKKCYVAGGFKI